MAADDALDEDLSDDDGCGCCHMADDRMEVAFDEEGDAVVLAREAGRSADFRADVDDDDDDDEGDDAEESEDNACGIRARVVPAVADVAAAAPLAFVLPVAANSEKAADVS